MRGAGKHEGEIEFRNGYFLNSIVGGEFKVDMNSIRVTDIPATDPIPIKRLTEHLKSADFFDVKRYPVSLFKILEIKKTFADSLEITGNMTIKNTTKNIRFNAFHNNKSYTGTFLIDRFQWNIAYAGNWTDKTLVD